MPPLAASRTQATTSGSIAYNLAGIAALVLLLAVGAAYFIDQAGQQGRRPAPAINDGNPLVQTIGGQELSIPQTWFRHGEQIRTGFASQVDISVPLALIEGQPAVAVDVTLLPRSRARASSTLLDAVYLHQFADGSRSGVPGLVGKPLASGNGYQGETVWYDALSPSPFVAKCVDPVEPGLPERCVRTVHLPGGLAAIFTFDAAALAGWRNFDARMALWLGRIGAL